MPIFLFEIIFILIFHISATGIVLISTFCKALLQKAEVLFASGEFEMSLVLFQRGHQSKPELEKFRLGVQKSTAAIQNAMTIKP